MVNPNASIDPDCAVHQSAQCLHGALRGPMGQLDAAKAQCGMRLARGVARIGRSWARRGLAEASGTPLGVGGRQGAAGPGGGGGGYLNGCTPPELRGGLARRIAIARPLWA